MERGEARSARVQSSIAFIGGAALVTGLALRGGTYDVVDRQEVGLLVWWILAFGLALGLVPRTRPPGRAFAPVLALGLLGAWTLVSLTWTASDERTLAEVTRVATYAGMLLLVVLVVDRHTWRSAAAGVTAGALLVAGLAAASRLVPEVFPADPARLVGAGRLNYPFDYWNAVGAWGAMALSAGLAWSVAAPRLLQRAAFLAALPLCGLSIYPSYSRGSVAGLVVGVALAILLCRPRAAALAHAAGAGLACAVVILVVRGYPELARGVARGDRRPVARQRSHGRGAIPDRTPARHAPPGSLSSPRARRGRRGGRDAGGRARRRRSRARQSSLGLLHSDGGGGGHGPRRAALQPERPAIPGMESGARRVRRAAAARYRRRHLRVHGKPRRPAPPRSCAMPTLSISSSCPSSAGPARC